MYSSHLVLFFHACSWKALSPSVVGGLSLGKFIFLHLAVLVFFAFSISFLTPAARISVRTELPHVRDFFAGSWSSSELF